MFFYCRTNLTVGDPYQVSPLTHVQIRWISPHLVHISYLNNSYWICVKNFHLLHKKTFSTVLVCNHTKVSSFKSIFINAKIHILHDKISIFAFTQIVFEQRYLEMIAPLEILGRKNHRFSKWEYETLEIW